MKQALVASFRLAVDRRRRPRFDGESCSRSDPAGQTRLVTVHRRRAGIQRSSRNCGYRWCHAARRWRLWSMPRPGFGLGHGREEPARRARRARRAQRAPSPSMTISAGAWIRALPSQRGSDCSSAHQRALAQRGALGRSRRASAPAAVVDHRHRDRQRGQPHVDNQGLPVARAPASPARSTRLYKALARRCPKACITLEAWSRCVSGMPAAGPGVWGRPLMPGTTSNGNRPASASAWLPPPRPKLRSRSPPFSRTHRTGRCAPGAPSAR